MPTFSLIALMLVFGAFLLAAVVIGAWLQHSAKMNTSPLKPVSDAVNVIRRRFEKPEPAPEDPFKFPDPRS